MQHLSLFCALVRAQFCSSSALCGVGSGCFCSCIHMGVIWELECERPPHWSICQLVLVALGMLQSSFMLPFLLQKSTPAFSLKHGSWIPREQRQNLSDLSETNPSTNLAQSHVQLTLLFKASHVPSPATKVNRLHLMMGRVACTNGENRNC